MSQKLTRPKPSPVYLPTEDPLLEKLYIARVATPSFWNACAFFGPMPASASSGVSGV